MIWKQLIKRKILREILLKIFFIKVTQYVFNIVTQISSLWYKKLINKDHFLVIQFPLSLINLDHKSWNSHWLTWHAQITVWNRFLSPDWSLCNSNWLSLGSKQLFVINFRVIKYYYVFYSQKNSWLFFASLFEANLIGTYNV